VPTLIFKATRLLLIIAIASASLLAILKTLESYNQQLQRQAPIDVRQGSAPTP
jgi:hypothetical protein